jgi:hypothetical protein
MPKIVPSRTLNRRILILATLSVSLVVGTGAAGATAAAGPLSLSVADADTWTVPANVSSIVIELTGGDGGTATSSLQRSSTSSGGRGGYTKATFAVREGDVLAFRVATAGTGVDIATSPLNEVAGGTGAGSGGEGWATGGGSSSAEINGSLAAGAPGGGGGSAAFSLQQGLLLTSSGGDGGSDGAPIVNSNGDVVAYGAVAGGNGAQAGAPGSRSTFANGNTRFIAVVSGGGGAGWPGGSGGVYLNDGVAGIAYGAGGAGGDHFASPDATDVAFDVKSVDEPATGSARVTYFVGENPPTGDSSLAPTGADGATSSLIGVGAIVLLSVGIWAVRSQNGRRSPSRVARSGSSSL